MTAMRGIRGAIQVEEDTSEAISQATRRLLETILKANAGLLPADLASIVFSVTDDLCASYPAQAARDIPGLASVPLLCVREIPVPGSLPRCLRVLLHWNTSLTQEEICHVYLGEAASLRPDLARPWSE